MRKIFVCVLLLLLAGCIVKPAPAPKADQPIKAKTGYYEITEYDVLKMIDEGLITGAQVSVRGITIGDQLTDIIKVLGMPQYMDEFDQGNIINAKYSNKNNQTVVIFNLVNDSVERMTIREGFAPFLLNYSRLEYYELANITTRFGKPDLSYDTQFTRVYEYHDEGLEFFHRRKHATGFALVRPKNATV